MNGRCEFTDVKNNLVGFYEIGKGGAKKGPNDYLTGQISKADGTVVSTLRGNYMGYLDFDSTRYFDLREIKNYNTRPISETTKTTEMSNSLPLRLASDCTLRPDVVSLIASQVDQAQENKNNLELLQRADRKLREEAAKRREKGGA